MRLYRSDDGAGGSVGLFENGAIYDVGALGSEPAVVPAAGPERLLEVARHAPRRVSSLLDDEGEPAIVIGTRCRVVEEPEGFVAPADDAPARAPEEVA